MFLENIYLIPLFPAVGAAIMFFFGRKISKQAVNAVCVGAVALTFIFACGSVLQYNSWADANNHQPYQKILYTWLGSDTGLSNYVKHDGRPGNFQADAGFLLDPLSCIWLLFVTGVGTLIHIYSTGYMAHEGGYYRFFGYLNLFMFSMLTLILANNYVLMFVGWEGVGLCSYLLIGFFFQRKSAGDAANKAFITNRIGDAGFILGMFFIVWYMGSLRYVDVNAAARSGHYLIGDPIITAATLLLFVGACGKSAQLPLYVWLPDAMEGPTPVSALIHAATMVTAGVYMVARSNALFILAPTSMKTVAIVGALTADLCGFDWAGAERYQAGVGLFNGFATWIHVPCVGRWSILRRRLPRIHARVLQGVVVPRGRLRDSRHERRAGHAEHGRPARQDSDDVLDDVHRDARHLGHPALCGILLEGRNPLADVDQRRWRVSNFVVRRLRHGSDDCVLHVPAHLPYFLQQAADESRSRAPHPRIPCVDDDAAGRSGSDVAIRRLPGMAAQSWRLGPFRAISSIRCFRVVKPMCSSNKAERRQVAAGEKEEEHTSPTEYLLMFLSVAAARLGLVHGRPRLCERGQGICRADREGVSASLQTCYCTSTTSTKDMTTSLPAAGNWATCGSGRWDWVKGVRGSMPTSSTAR